jgi:hypothetical protein
VPSASDHEQQADSNEKFYNELGAENTTRSDWAMTTLFYCAIHDVQAVAIRKGWRVKYQGAKRFPEDHNERLRIVSKHLQPIEAEYRSLKDWSEGARYRCETFNSAQLKLAKSTLGKIRKHTASLK